VSVMAFWFRFSSVLALWRCFRCSFFVAAMCFFFSTAVVVFSDVCLLQAVFSGVLVYVDVVCFLVCKEQGVLCFLFGV
jgi:hypothetical protein